MRHLTSTCLAVALLATLPSIPGNAEAGTGVLRCRMADGSSVYTYKACSDFGATAAPLPGDVLTRIERDRRLESRLSGIDPESIPTTQLQAGPRRALASGCARNPQQLGADLQASMALGDVNRVAESFDWTGMRNAQAQSVMDQLDRMTQRGSVVDAEFFEAQLAGADQAGLMQVTFNADGGNRVDDFEVSRQQGCYFLRYA